MKPRRVAVYDPAVSVLAAWALTDDRLRKAMARAYAKLLTTSDLEVLAQTGAPGVAAPGPLLPERVKLLLSLEETLKSVVQSNPSAPPVPH